MKADLNDVKKHRLDKQLVVSPPKIGISGISFRYPSFERQIEVSTAGKQFVTGLT